MKIRFAGIFLVFPATVILFLFASCGPAILPIPAEPSATPQLLASPTLVSDTPPPLASSTPCPAENWPCPSDSMTLTAEMAPVLTGVASGPDAAMTAAMGLTFAAIPSNTPPAWATVIPVAGDLGWGSVYGIISDGLTNLPIEGATVTCEHFSYTSPYPCKGTGPTNQDGVYSFTPVYFHDTDKITLIVEAPGYLPLRFEETGFTRPEFHADLGLFPVSYASPTPTPFLMCTAPACVGGVLACGSPSGCLGGCGTICIPFSPTP